MLAKFVAVALIAMSPIGEELVSIPADIALRLDDVAVAIMSVAFNMLPALAISGVFWRAERGTRVVRWPLRVRPALLRLSAIRLLQRRSRRLAAVWDRWGIWAVVVITPWAGVYATTLTLEASGMERRRPLAAVFLGLAVHAVMVALISSGAYRLLRP